MENNKYVFLFLIIVSYLQGCSSQKVYRFYSSDNIVNIKEYARAKTAKDIKQYYNLKRAVENKFYPEYIEVYHKPKKMYTYILPQEICARADSLNAIKIKPYFDKVRKMTLEENFKKISNSNVNFIFYQSNRIHGNMIVYEYDKQECTITFSRHKGW